MLNSDITESKAVEFVVRYVIKKTTIKLFSSSGGYVHNIIYLK